MPDERGRPRPSEVGLAFNLRVTFNGNEFAAQAASDHIDTLTEVFTEWLAAQRPLTQDQLDALVVSQQRTASKLETIRGALGALATPWHSQKEP